MHVHSMAQWFSRRLPCSITALKYKYKLLFNYLLVTMRKTHAAQNNSQAFQSWFCLNCAALNFLLNYTQKNNMAGKFSLTIHA